MGKLTRRQILQGAAASISAFKTTAAHETNVSAEASRILARIKAPSFPNRDFEITKFGAVPGGEELCTGAIKSAIAACSQAGGGRVVVPAGVFLTGAIHLESNVNLYVSKDATVKFSHNQKDYLPVVFTRFESTECMNFSPFIYAFEKNNVAVSGPGTLDGQADADHWWNLRKKQAATAGAGGPEDDRKRLVEMGNK